MRRVLTVFLTSFVAGTVAHASPILFVTPGSSSVAGGPVSATAEFSFSAGSLTLTLSNNQQGIANAGQLLTDIFFTLSDVDTASLTAVTGTQIRFDGGSGTADPLVGNWRLRTGITPFPGGFHLDMLFQQPNLGIIGPNPNPNGSLVTGSHNPFYDQTATFTITSPDITAQTVVSGVVFSFGTAACTSTTDGNCIGGRPGDPGNPVPEPAGLIMFGTGLLALAGFARRIRSRNSA